MQIDNKFFWEMARKVVSVYSVDAPAFAAYQMEVAARTSDVSTIKAWHAIAERIDLLMDPMRASYDEC